MVFTATWLYALLVLVLRYLKNKITLLHSLFIFNVSNILLTLPIFMLQTKTEWGVSHAITAVVLSLT